MAQCCDSDFLSVRYWVRLQPWPSIHGGHLFMVLRVVNSHLNDPLSLSAPGQLRQMNGKL